MHTAGTLVYRNFDTQHDFARLAALLREVEQADHDGEDVSEDALREQLTWAGHDPAQDRRVAIVRVAGTEGEIEQFVGFGTVFMSPNDTHADIYVAVHQAWRRRGIGSALLARVLERAREKGASDTRVYANAEHKAPNDFLLKHGFAPVAAYMRMAIAGKHSFPAPDMPSGFTVRSYAEVRDMRIMLEALNRGYEGLWGHRNVSEEEMAEWFPQLPQEGVFLLFAPDGSVAGTVRAGMNEHLSELRGTPTGLVDAPGVVPEYRQFNLYRPLLLTTLHWLAAQNPAHIELESWGDAPETLALYHNLGFKTVQEQISYRLSL